MNSSSHSIVRAVSCNYQASDEEVYAALRRATDPLESAWQKLSRAQRIAIKFNQDWPPAKVVRYQGELQELVSRKLTRAVLRLLRERTSAELISCDTSVHAQADPNLSVLECMTIDDILGEFGVPHYDSNHVPMRLVQVPGGGLMFRQYQLPEPLAEADAVVSVQKIKNHRFMGTTLCLKNLFGLLPQPPRYHARQYFHHLIRMAYMLPDLGLLTQPTLNILDGMVCQANAEWGGAARIGNTLVAGDHVIATDVVATHLMGHDAEQDWPSQPYIRDRNPLRAAAEAGFGTTNLDDIDWTAEVQAPIAAFGVDETDSFETVTSWRRSTCEQALHYRDHAKSFYDKYAGQYILVQNGEVVWHDVTSDLRVSRRKLAGIWHNQALWLKFVDPQEAEGEHFEVYEKTLSALQQGL
ncbi:MAG: DUF362 domain-containing protein [Chloroflexi bacterium]|nr:DUF362 domain-containing protein [Chloroflexota bacterium]